MIIYFEDGSLNWPSKTLKHCDYVIDAGNGYSMNDCHLELIQKLNPKAIIYTNSIVAFSNIYAWDEEAQVPQIYIRNKEGIFTRIDEMTNRELKQGHNLWRLYEANEFGNL